MLGKGLHPGSTREVPGLNHCFGGLVGGVIACGKKGMGSGERHILGVEIL